MRGIFIFLAATIISLPSAVQGDDTGTAFSSDPVAIASSDPSPVSPAASEESAEFPPPPRHQGMRTYVRGQTVAEQKRDYVSALRFFREALALEKSAATLYAIGQCQKVLNRQVEALFTLANALYEDNSMPPADRLPDTFARAARDSIDDLMKRLITIRVTVPKGERLARMTVNGLPLVSTDLFGQMKHNIIMAGVRPDGTLREPASYPDSFAFLTKPGAYPLAFIFADGRQMSMEKRTLTAATRHIDLNRERPPARIVVENIQPGMRIVFKGANQATILDRTFAERQQRVALGGLTQGQYDLVVSRSGFRDFSASYHLYDGQKERVFLDLKPKPLISSWKLWLGVGLVAAAGIVTTVVVLTTRDRDDSPENGRGVVTLSVF